MHGDDRGDTKPGPVAGPRRLWWMPAVLLLAAACSGDPSTPSEASGPPTSTSTATSTSTSTATSEVATSDDAATAAAPRGEGNVWSFLPLETGRRWTYDITFPRGGPDPHYVHEIFWTGLDRYRATVGSYAIDPGESFELTLAVGPAGTPEQEPPPFQEPGVVPYQIEVVIDDLLLYNEADRVWWAFTNQGILTELVEYAPTWPGEQVEEFTPEEIGWGSELRDLGFDKPVGEGTYYREDHIIRSEGYDEPAPAWCEGQRCLRLRREIAIAGGPSGSFGDKIDEVTWLADGIGLVRLEQHVDDELAMVWALRRP